MSDSKDILREGIVSFFFLGRAPVAPGTFGSFGAVILAYLVATYIASFAGFVLLALAAVFVGGTPYWGGLGTIVGAVFGVGIIAYMEIGIIAIGWSGTWRQFFNGLIILLALLGHRLHGERVR